MNEFTIDLQPVAGFNLDLEQYVGLWLVDETRFGAMLEQVSRMDLAAHCTANVGRPVIDARVGMTTADDIQIAVVDIQGTITKRGSSMSGAGSSIRLRQAIRQAASSDTIGGIVLRIDSPGGTVSGTADLAAEIAAASEKKPVWAFIEDVAASAAYWVASQATQIKANNATAAIGSIGTFMALYDMSTAAQIQGIKAIVIRSGALKGAGFPGAEITDEQKAVWQEIVDKTQAEFSAGVARGRKMTAEQVAKIADGRMWLANDAKDLGLIDGISSFDEVLSDMAAEIQRRTSLTRRKRMSDVNTPQAATYAELKAACVGADPAFLCSQMEASATTEAAVRAWMGEQSKRLDVANEEAAKAKAEAEKAKAQKPGVDTLGGNAKNADDNADPIAAWNTAIDAKMSTGLNKGKATAAVVRQNPELHAAYLATVNAR